jgi:hypothetical protein
VQGQSSRHGFAKAGRGSAVLIAGACLVLAAAAWAAVFTLLFVRHAHTDASGAGYWTDVFGFRAGVDNIGPRTLVTIFLNWDLHWQHNLAELGSIVVGLCAFFVGRRYWGAAKGASGAAPLRAPFTTRGNRSSLR